MPLILFILLPITGIALIITRPLPYPFPWMPAALLGLVMFNGLFTPTANPARFMIYGLFLSAVLIGARVPYSRRIYAALGIIVALLVLADTFRLIPTPDVIFSPSSIYRRPGAIGHPNHVAAWALLFPFGWWTIITVLCTESRGALLGLLVAGFFYMPRSWRGWVILAGILIMVPAIQFRWAEAFSRFDIWENGLRLFLAHPITGSGTGSVATLISPLLYHSHNALITILAENGLLGAIPFVWMIGALALLLVKSDHPMRYGLLALLVQNITDDTWLHPFTSILLGLVLAACLLKTNEP